MARTSYLLMKAIVLVIVEMNRIMQKKDMKKELLFENAGLEVEEDKMVDFDELEGSMLPSNDQEDNDQTKSEKA